MLIGCQGILGIEEGTPSVSTTGGGGAGARGGGRTEGGDGGMPSTSTGGMGGHRTGGGAITQANDWSPFMAAVYPFEGMLERDASPFARHLGKNGCTSQIGTPQGMSVVTSTEPRATVIRSMRRGTRNVVSPTAAGSRRATPTPSCERYWAAFSIPGS